MSNAAEEVAAGLTLDIATELVAKSAPSDLAGSQLVEEIQAAAAEPTAPSNPQPVAPEGAQETETETKEDDLDLTGFRLIEFDDEDDDPDDEVLAPAARAEPDDDEIDLTGYENDDELRARLAAAEKKAKHYETQALEAKQGQWRARYRKMYPLANIDEIYATSRRAFERQAIASHNSNYVLFKPLLDRLENKAATLTETVTAEARTEAQAAFGKPLAGPGIVPLEQSAATEDLVAARKTGDLRKVISVLMGTNK